MQRVHWAKTHVLDGRKIGGNYFEISQPTRGAAKGRLQDVRGPSSDEEQRKTVANNCSVTKFQSSKVHQWNSSYRWATLWKANWSEFIAHLLQGGGGGRGAA